MRRPLTVIFRLFFLSVDALLAFGCQWGGDIYLDEGPDSETTSEETEFNGTTDTDSDMDTDTDTGTDTGTGVDTVSDTGTGTGVDTETDTGTGTGVDSETDTGTETEAQESDSGSETESSTEIDRDNTILILVYLPNEYDADNPPGDEICLYFLPDKQFADFPPTIGEIDFKTTAPVYCSQEDNLTPPSPMDPIWIVIYRPALDSFEPEDRVMCVGVLFRNGNTGEAPQPDVDFWGFAPMFDAESVPLRDPYTFGLNLVRESPPPPDDH